MRTDADTAQTIIAGMGELHLEVLVDRMLREFSVQANVGKPQVAYRETLSAAVADHTFAAATPVLSATRPISTPARRSRTARRERHVMTIAPAMTVALPAASAGATAGWTVARPATTQVSAAAGASVHALPITRRSDRACRPAASRRSPALREGRRHW